MDCSAHPIRVPVARSPPASRLFWRGLADCLMTASAIGVDLPNFAPAGCEAGPTPAKELPGGNHHEQHHRAAIGRDRNRGDRRHQPSCLLPRHEPAGTPHVLGLRRRLGARRHGFHDLSAGHRHHHRDVEGRCWRGGPCRHGHTAGLGRRGLARRLSGRPHRPGQNAAIHDPVVLAVLAGLRRRCRISINC